MENWMSHLLPRSIVLLVTLLAACGDETPAGSDGGNVGTGPYLPLAVGATWTYQVTTPGQPTATKTSTVEVSEDVGGMKAGTVALRVRTEKTDGVTISWQVIGADETVVRHREKSFELDGTTLKSDVFYNPQKLRVDGTAAHTAMGATWVDAYTEISIDPLTMAMTTNPKTETWTVEAVAEEITVPAGTFTCLRLHRSGDANDSVKRYWFARGIGKIREESLGTGGGQVEALASYTLP